MTKAAALASDQWKGADKGWDNDSDRQAAIDAASRTAFLSALKQNRFLKHDAGTEAAIIAEYDKP